MVPPDNESIHSLRTRFAPLIRGLERSTLTFRVSPLGRRPIRQLPERNWAPNYGQ